MAVHAQLLEQPDVLQRYLERAALKGRWRALAAPFSSDLVFMAFDFPSVGSDATSAAEPLVGLNGALQRGRVPSRVRPVCLWPIMLRVNAILCCYTPPAEAIQSVLTCSLWPLLS